MKNYFTNLFGSKDYIIKEFIISKIKVFVLFNEVLTDSTSINKFILSKMLYFNRCMLKNIDNYLPDTNVLYINFKDISKYINNGYLVIYSKYFVVAIEVKKDLDRGVNTIEGEVSITGPKDSFCENFNTNLGLIRKRIKSCDLISKDTIIGKSTCTKIGLIYMDNIVDIDIVNKIYKRISDINIDGIIDSTYLKKYLDKSLYPTVILTERPDLASMALLEGKVVIVCDNSPYVLIMPSFFIDFFHTSDDYYQRNLNTSFIRIIRLLAFIIAILTPAIYIAVTTRNYDLVSLPLLLILKSGRTFVPFPAYIEALFMIIAFEILKETDLRMSSKTGSAVSILGGLILGDAAVSAGIVSPIMIIVIAISSIAGLIFTSLELSNLIRFIKIILLILSSLFGMFGIVLGSTYFIYRISNLNVYGRNYLEGLNPFKREFFDSFVRSKKSYNYRNPSLTKNICRGRDA